VTYDRSGGFLRLLRFHPPIELTTNDITDILLKVALNTITALTHPHSMRNIEITWTS
jgi:hypothetical protein